MNGLESPTSGVASGSEPKDLLCKRSNVHGRGEHHLSPFPGSLIPDLCCKPERSPVFAATHSSLDTMPHSILVINPNSSESVTSGLRDTLSPLPDTTLTFYTAPSHAPPSINDLTTANLTATACFEDIRAKGLVELYDSFPVCCCTSPPSPSS